MALLRGIVGFLTFLLAFSLRTDGSPTWHFGVVLALSAVGSLTGAALAPALRRQASEERIISGLLVVVAVAAVVGAWLGSLPGAALVAVMVGVGAASAKQAFDSIVQRDAPDANRGRSFARFETRFQLVWVAGAVLGIIPMPMWLGFVLVAATSAFAGVSYAAGSRGVHDVDQRRRRRRIARRHPAGGSTDATTIAPMVPPSIATPAPRQPAEDPTIVEGDR